MTDPGLPTTEARTEQTDHKAHIQDNLSEGLPALLAEATRLADAATPGPWTVEYDDDSDENGTWQYPSGINGASDPLGAWKQYPASEVSEMGAANAEFIAASRSLVPQLVARVAGLVAERQEIQQRADHEMECWQLERDAYSARCFKAEAERDGLRVRIEEFEELNTWQDQMIARMEEADTADLPEKAVQVARRILLGLFEEEDEEGSSVYFNRMVRRVVFAVRAAVLSDDGSEE